MRPLFEFLSRVSEKNASDLRAAGDDVSQEVYDQIKLLSMLEVLIGENARPDLLVRVEQISMWGPK
jgi:hypothetical protein